MPDPIRILHLSDIVPQTIGVDVPAVLERLRDSIIGEIGKEPRIDYIVVCGNLSAPSPPRFDHAGKLLLDLARNLLLNDGTGMNRVLFVPGIRDVTPDGGEAASNFLEFAQFHNSFFAAEIADGRLRPFQDADHALCRELKDLRFIGVSFWQSESAPMNQNLMGHFVSAIRDAKLQIGEARENMFAKSRPALLVSAGTPPPSWDKVDRRFHPMERLQEDLKRLNVSLHLFGSGHVTGILPHPFLFNHVSLGTGLRDETGFWPLQANLIEIRPELYRSRESGELESFLLSTVALLKRGPDEPLVTLKHIRGHLDLFFHREPPPLPDGGVYSAFWETLSRLMFQDGFAFVILSGLPGSGKFDFIEFVRSRPSWRDHKIYAELIELTGLHYQISKFKKDLREAGGRLRRPSTAGHKKILIVRDMVFAGLNNQDKDSVKTLWPLLQQIENLDAVIYTMPTVDFVLNYEPLRNRTKRLSLPALDADGMKALVGEYEQRFPVAEKLKDVSGQYAGFSRMLLDQADSEFRKLPGAAPIRPETASKLLLQALESDQLKDESAWYLAAIRSMAAGQEICDFLVREVSRHRELGDPIQFDADSLRSEIRSENGRAALDATLGQLREMGVLGFEGGHYCVRVPAPFIVEARRNPLPRTPLLIVPPVDGFAAPPAAVDFLIVVPLSEELDALWKHIPDPRQLNPSAEFPRTPFSATLPARLPQGTPGNYGLIVLPLFGPGTVQAASATVNAIKRWKPRYVVLLGIAGGTVKSGAAPGDILVADRIVDYSLEKVRNGSVEPRYHVFETDRALLSAAHLLRKPGLAVPQRPGPGESKVLYGPVASGNRVIAGGQDIDRLLEAWPELIGVEMEAAGVAAAVSESTGRPGFFMVRGVSDNADSNKDSHNVAIWREYAAEAAAAYLIALLSRGPVEFNAAQASPVAQGPSSFSSIAAAPAAQAVAPITEIYAQLADYLVLSGRAVSAISRRSLCIRIGVKHTTLDFLENTSAEDFAIQLVDHLRATGDYVALRKLCAALNEHLKGHVAEKVAAIQRSFPA